jgi:hypothetical protein
MQQRWVLDDVLKTDEYNQDHPDSLHATVIDSATDDDWHDEYESDAQGEINSAINNSQWEDDDDLLQLDQHIVSEDVPSSWTHEKKVTSVPAVRDLCHDLELNSWWLKSGREPLSKIRAKGLGGGVLRRRSMSKMLYHAAEYTDNSPRPNTNHDDEVCIVATLGGGTGSGMAIDLARDLDSNRTHLFAILPHDGAGDNERMNAHAALSELEYVSLTGESPFDNITLVPHIKYVSDKDKDFERAVVRTILAHQNGMRGGNLPAGIVPASQGGDNPPIFAPFTLAVPYTVKFNINVRDKAERNIDDTLGNKQTELQHETDLLEVLKKLFKNEFNEGAREAITSNHRDATIDGERAAELRERLVEDLRGEFLEQNAFETAGLGDLVDRIKNEFDEIIDDDSLITDDDGSFEQARDFIDVAPADIRANLNKRLEYDESDRRADKLVDVLVQELINIETRVAVLRATSLLTHEQGLSEEHAEMIQRAITEVILDEDADVPRKKIRNPTLDEYIESLETDAIYYNQQHQNLSEFYEIVAKSLSKDINAWRVSVDDDAEQLAFINKHEDDVQKYIKSLTEEIEQKLNFVDNSENAAAVEGQELELSALRNLNDVLGETDISELNEKGLLQEFSRVKKIKKCILEHNPSPIPGVGTDKSQEFIEALAPDWNWFDPYRRNTNPTVDDGSFEFEVNSDHLDHDETFSSRKADVVDSICNEFVDTFTTESGELVSYRLSDAIEREISEDIVLPQDLGKDTLRTNLKNALESSDATSASDIMQSVLSADPIDPETPTERLSTEDGDDIPPITLSLFDGYLRRIAREREQVDSQLRNLVAGDEGLINDLSYQGNSNRLQGLAERESSGVIPKLKKVRAVCGYYSDEEWDIDPPRAFPRDAKSETYGRDFAANYDSTYSIDFETEHSQVADNHPYLKTRNTKAEELLGGPEHIGESDVLENRKHRVIRDFKNSVSSMFNNEHGHAPVQNWNPEGTGNSDIVVPEYKELRFYPIYMSRGLEEQEDMNQPLYDTIFDEFESENETVGTANVVYRPSQYSVGDPDEVTMVTFVGGLFLDNIKLVGKSSGYHDVYTAESATHEFVGSHHSIGLGGSEQWSTMREWTDRGDDTIEYGSYVHRSEVSKVNGQFMDKVMEHHEQEDKDARDVFLNMIEADRYESTVSLND